MISMGLINNNETCHVCYENVDSKIKCQYEKSKLFDYDDKKWCMFHNPDPNIWENASSLAQAQFNKTIESILKSAGNNKEDTVDFSYTKFPKGFKFPQNIYTVCKRNICIKFKSCDFFDQITFSNDASNIDFTDAKLHELVSFMGCTLYSNNFTNSIFYSGVNFYNCTIHAPTFYQTQFHKSACFTETYFFCAVVTEDTVIFDNVTFCEEAIFYNASFASDIIFRNIIFKGKVDFSYTGVHSLAVAILAKNDSNRKIIHEIGDISFINCEFNSSTFKNRIFTGKTDFSSSVFYKAPLFHGCKFHQHTIFPEQKKFKDTSSMEAAHAYRTIYLEMINLKSRDYINMFYALMQKSERNSGMQKCSIRIASWLYEKTTNYGQNISKPIFLLTILTILFGVIYALLASPYYDLSSSIDWNIIWNGFDTSIKQIVKPFSYYAEIFSEKSPIIFKISAMAQSILSLSLITLFLLSLRWKFKKD